MKKNHLGLVCAIGILVVLGSSYLLLANHNRIQEANLSESESESGITVNTAEYDQITSFQLANSDISYTLTKTEQNWICIQDESFPLSKDSVTELVNGLASFQAVRDLGNMPDDEDYGFTESSPSITLTLADESSIHFTLGSVNSLTDDYYLNSDDNNHLYTVSSSIAQLFSKTLNDLALIEEFPVVSSSNMESLSITEGTNTLLFDSSTVGSVKSWTIARSSDSGKTVSSAEKALVNTVTTMVDQLGNISFDDFIDYKKENLENYGFKNPSLVLTFQYTLESEEDTSDTDLLTATLYVGDKTEDDSYYVHLNDSNNVYTISSDKLTYFQELDYDEYLQSEEETETETSN